MKSVNLLSGSCSKGIVLMLLAVFSFSSESVAQSPFVCTDTLYYQVDSNKLYSYSPEGTRTLVFTLTGDLNAIGYNTKDNLIWGYDNTTDQLFSLGSDGVISRFTILNLVPTAPYKFNVGTCDTNGYLYIYEKDATEYYTVDLDASRSTYLKLVNPLNSFEEKTAAPWSSPTSARTISDWAFNPADGMIYALTDGIAGNPFQILQVNPLTGSSTVLPGQVTGDGIQDNGNMYQAFGSCFFDVDGNFLVFGNVNGHLFLVNLNTKLATRITSVGTPTTANDGAFCPLASYDPLPISLLFFEAKEHSGKSILNWATANEQGNKGFEVERSTDGSRWTSLGFVPSKAEDGNSTASLSYAYTDAKPVPAKNYYRLKEISLGGKYEYSEIRTVDFSDAVHINVYPNPVKENVTITGLKGNNIVYVSNSLGQMLIRETAAGDTKNLSTAQLAPGIYMITVQDKSNNKYNFKMVKQ